MASIKIGPSYFHKELKEYADWRWAYAREALQNSMDSGATKIDVTITENGDNTTIVFENDGNPMTETTLVDKLLALGESGKEFVGTAGGFGKAKILLYMSHQSYIICTGTLEVVGCGGEYTLRRDLPYFHGTRSVVTLAGNEISQLSNAFRRFANMAQWSGTLTLNGKVLETNFRKGYHRRDFEWAQIYTNQQFQNLLIVRIDGQPMFTRYCSWKGCVLIELTGNSGERLVATRDRLNYVYQNELDKFVDALSVDTKSALRSLEAEYRLYHGSKVRPAKKNTLVHDIVLQKGQKTAAFLAPVAATAAAPASYGGVHTAVLSRDEDRTVSIGPEFILKSTTGLVTPGYYMPGDQFSKYSVCLVKAWAHTLKHLYELMELEGEFSVGFILDEESLAEHEQSSEYGKVYYLSPASIVKNQRFNSRSYKARYSSAWTNRFEIISLAIHEFVHGAYNIGAHSEDFASKLTEITAVVMTNLKDFAQYYR